MNLNDTLKYIPPKTKIAIWDLDAARKPVDGKSGYMIVLNIRRPRK